MELIVSELIPAAPLTQEFQCVDHHSVERIRLHLAFKDIDKTTNPGTLTLTLKNSAGGTIDTKAYTFAQIKSSGGTIFGTALDSTSQQWHGFVSFIWDPLALNLVPGTYTLELAGSYTYTYDVSWVGWVREHDDFIYKTYNNETFPADLVQEEVPLTFQLWTWQRFKD